MERFRFQMTSQLDSWKYSLKVRKPPEQKSRVQKAAEAALVVSGRCEVNHET